jgi:uncharacterized caspase-like protein
MSQIKDWFELIPAKQITVIVDACFAGIVGNIKIGTRGAVPLSNVTAKDLQPPSPQLLPSENNRDLIIIAAGSSNQVALEGPRWGHGLFTFHILNGLMGKADLNLDGIIAAGELFTYIYPKVVNDSDNRQNPQIFGWGKVGFPLVKINPGLFKSEDYLVTKSLAPSR